VPDKPQAANLVWVNGQAGDSLPVSDRGLAFGDGVFETIRLGSAGPILLEQHLQRLQQGLQRLSIHHDWSRLESEIRAFPGWHQTSPAIIKLIITRGSGGRGYGTANVAGPNRVYSCHPAPVYDPDWFQRGIAVYPCQQRLASDPALAGIKHLNRLPQVLARQEWQQQPFQEGLLLDQQGQVVEGVFSNLFLIRAGRVFTPALDACGVAGVMRGWLLEQFAGAGINLMVGPVTLQDIELADEWFFCNSVYGIWPVRQWNNRVWAVGDITRRAQQWVSDLCQF